MTKKASKKSPGKAERSPAAGGPEYLRKFGDEVRAVISKAEFTKWLGGSRKIVDRMLHASRYGDPWLEIVGNRKGKGGARVMIDYESAQRAYERLKNGETPPLMPSERAKAPVALVRGDKDKGTPTKQGSALMAALALTPMQAEEVTFYPRRKMFAVQWQNGEYQWFRVSSGRGRMSKLFDITFMPAGSANLKKTLDRPTRRRGYDAPDMD